MKPRVYLETTVISYLTAWRSPQLVMAAQQEATRSWWDEERHHFDLFVSEIVVQEASAAQKAMRGICKEAGCTLPLICTPLELIEERNDD